jgi:formylglycine-generating enzyme required for sulfatase activity
MKLRPLPSLCAALLALCPILANAQTSAVPDVISFQGRALTATGALMGSDRPVNRTVIFRIWAHATNSLEANLKYSEQQVVTIADGEFSVLIGAGLATEGSPLGYYEGDLGPGVAKISESLTTTDASTGLTSIAESRFLGVTIDDGTEAADTEFSPRHQILSGAFALRSKVAETLVDGAITNLPTEILLADNIMADAITSAQIADGTVATSDIGVAQVSTDQIADLSITYDKFAHDLPAGMVRIPAGNFTLGNSVAVDTDITDATAVSTFVSEFFLGANLVTYGEWSAVNYYGEKNGYSFTGSDALAGQEANLGVGGVGESQIHPVHSVSWYDAVKWCNARSEMEGLTPVYYTNADQTVVYKKGNEELNSDMVKWIANGYRLPTEAEWERAARGGLSNQRFPWGDSISQNLANYEGDSLVSYDNGPSGSHPLGMISAGIFGASLGNTFAPNVYGLHDMAGNLDQWCWDWYGTPYAAEGDDPPRGSASGTSRVRRGGSWNSGPSSCRVAFRSYGDPALSNESLGFRVARSPGP